MSAGDESDLSTTKRIWPKTWSSSTSRSWGDWHLGSISDEAATESISSTLYMMGQLLRDFCRILTTLVIFPLLVAHGRNRDVAGMQSGEHKRRYKSRPVFNIIFSCVIATCWPCCLTMSATQPKDVNYISELHLQPATCYRLSSTSRTDQLHKRMLFRAPNVYVSGPTLHNCIIQSGPKK